MNTTIKNRDFTNWVLLGICLLIIVSYMHPFWLKGKDAHFLIHDNADSAPLAHSRIFLETPAYLFPSGESIQRILNGNLPSGGINTQLDRLPYYFMDGFVAFVFTELISRIVAFFCLLLLLKEVLPPMRSKNFAATGAGLLFALLPHYPFSLFTVTALPLLPWALIRIHRQNNSWVEWATLCILPFFTFLLLAPVFAVALAFIWNFYRLLIKGERNTRLWTAIGITTFFYIIANYNLFTQVFLDSTFISHRSIRQPTGTVSLIGGLERSVQNFLHGQYHVATIHLYIVLPMTIIAIAGGFWRRMKGLSSEKEKNLLSQGVAILLLIGAISLVYGLSKWESLSEIKSALGPFAMVQWSRFHWLHPLLWYTLWGISFLLISQWGKPPRILASVAILVQAALLFWNSDSARMERSGSPTFRAFYAEDQFSEIADFIGKDPSTYRVASLGIHPSIALYNGFYCLDGYIINYSLEYHKAFREIISGELAKDQILADYYDKWGSRCYIFSEELGRNFIWTKDRQKTVQDLSFNSEAFRNLGGEYLISAVPIENAPEIGLKFFKRFPHPESAWEIFLYRAD